MKKIYVIAAIYLLFSFSKDQSECNERSMPYWANGINSRVEGENITLRKAFREVQNSKKNIRPANGFITLRLHISKTGKLCNMETFQIDENYQDVQFNNGKLVNELREIAAALKNWKRDKNFKTYNLIRLKIKDGKIEEVF